MLFIPYVHTKELVHVHLHQLQSYFIHNVMVWDTLLFSRFNLSGRIISQDKDVYSCVRQRRFLRINNTQNDATLFDFAIDVLMMDRNCGLRARTWNSHPVWYWRMITILNTYSRCGICPWWHMTVQSQKAVAVHFTSEQLLPFWLCTAVYVLTRCNPFILALVYTVLMYIHTKNDNLFNKYILWTYVIIWLTDWG